MASLGAVAVDPVTAAEVTFSIAASLNDLFGKKGEQEATKKRLKEIIAQNRQILKTLNEIVGVLNNLGVTIRENVRLETIYNLQATHSGLSDQVMEAWLAELEDSRAARQAATRYQQQLLPGVRNVTHQLLDEGYGYAAYDTVGQGMLMEFWMSRRVGERAAFRQQAADTYRRYFDRALDPALAATPAHELADATAKQARLQQVLAAADAQIGATGYARVMGRRNAVENERNSGQDYDEVSYDIVDTVTKASDGSYVVTTSRRETSRRHVHDRGGGPCGRCVKLMAPPDPVDNGNSAPAGRAAYWNAVRADLAQTNAKVAALTKAKQTLEMYRQQALAPV